MKSLLIAELPDGAEATITLKNGKTFTGTEDSRDGMREAGVLRMVRQAPNSNEYIVFFCLHEEVACFSMECQN